MLFRSLVPSALIAAGVAAVLVVAALFLWRANGRRAERLTESYWDLRYEIGQLKARVNRLELAAGMGESGPEPEPDAAPSRPSTSFVPLSSLKK